MPLSASTIRRGLALAGLLAAPGVVATLVLAVLGDWRAGPVALAILLIVAVAVLIAAVHLREIDSLLHYIRGLGPAAEREPPPHMIGESGRLLAAAAARLQTRWRRQDRTQAARLEDARTIIEVIGDPLLVLRADRVVASANGAALRLFGGGIEGRDLAVVLRHPDVLSAVDAVLAGGEATRIAFTRPVPVERMFELEISPFRTRNDSGRESLEPALLLTLHDITKIKRAERMRADFVANASHELRTPLSALSGFIETLSGPAREDPEARDRFLAIMGQQTERMSRLVRDLLSLSHIELGEHTPPQDRCDLGGILGGVAAALEIKARERQMTIVPELPDDLPPVPGDADQLTQIFQNLLANAIAYGRPGTEVTIKARPATTAGIGPGVSVSVRDRGDGIAGEHLSRLTERFYRVDPARSRALGGTGLGLAIVKHIVNRHRGRLSVESEVGQGSIFTIFLPALQDRPTTAEKRGPARKSSRRKQPTTR